MADLGLVVKFKCAIHPGVMKAIQEDLVRQKESGVIVLPANCEALVIPTDVQIKVESEPLKEFKVVECPTCHGTGTVASPLNGLGVMTCPRCNGTREVINHG